MNTDRKSSRTLKPASLLAAISAILSAAASPTTDWSKLSGEQTIPEGETWDIQASDMKDIEPGINITKILFDGNASALKLTGESPIEMGDLAITFKGNKNRGMMIIENAQQVIYPTDSSKAGDPAFGIGGNQPKCLRVTNSCLTCGSGIEATADNATRHALAVGWKNAMSGVLIVDAGAVLTNKLIVGRMSGSTGAVYQNDGMVECFGYAGASYNGQSTIGYEGHAYYRLMGGECRFYGRPVVSRSMGSVGLIEVSGGTFSLEQSQFVSADPWFFLGYATGSLVHLYATGGMVNMRASNGSSQVVSLYNKNENVTLTVAGKNARVITPDWYIGWNDNGGGELNINLNAGVLETSPFRSRASNDSARANDENVYVNFNGGTLKAAVGAQNLFQAKPDKHFKVSARVYEKGATIDSSYRDAKLSISLVPASGNGVRSIAVPVTIADRTFVAPPFVKIVRGVGDETGVGATAYAKLDPATARLKGIEVTSAGWDYAVDPTAEFYVGTEKIGEATCVCSPNQAGGFTKTGPDLFTLEQPNFWAQWTKVIGGTLKAGVAGSIPNGTALTLSNGAMLDLNSTGDMVITGLAGNGGKVSNGKIKVVGDLKMSAKQFSDDDVVAIDGTVDLSEAASVTLTDVDLLTDEYKDIRGGRMLFTATKLSGAANVPVNGLPSGWDAAWRRNGLKIWYRHGFSLILR